MRCTHTKAYEEAPHVADLSAHVRDICKRWEAASKTQLIAHAMLLNTKTTMNSTEWNTGT